MLWNNHNLSVAKIASKSDMKPEIAGVYFTSKLTCATDGVRLLEVRTPADVKVEDFPMVDGKAAMRGVSPFIVSAQSLRELKIPKKTNLPICQNVAIKHLDDKQAQLLTTDLETANITTIRRVEGKFPDYEKLFPAGDPVAQVVLNGELLAELLKIMAKLDQVSEVKISFYSGEKPVVLESGNKNQKARALLMPIREN